MHTLMFSLTHITLTACCIDTSIRFIGIYVPIKLQLFTHYNAWIISYMCYLYKCDVLNYIDVAMTKFYF